MGDTLEVVRTFPFADLTPAFNARGASTHELINERTPASMAAGVVYFKDAEIPFTLWYDEVMFCFDVEKSFAIVVDGVENRLKPGDTIWLPAGTSLIYRATGVATAFFAVTPPDWAKRRPPA